MVQIIRRTGSKKKKDWNKLWELPIEPEPYNLKPITKVVATFDTETDPFAHGRIVRPFTCGFYIPEIDFYVDFWGEEGLCITYFFQWLEKVTAPGGEFEGWEFMVFCHNFGNFDFYFCVEYVDAGSKPFIINGRIVRISLQGHEFRDSYAMIPVALGEYDKEAIDYRCMEVGFRDVFRDKILHYQKRDCTALSELVTNWLEMFGDKMTMASVALPMLRSYHGFDTMSEGTDAEMRPYYFGGRNECFATGIMEGDFHVYDINSSYPDVMRRYRHPIGSVPKFETKITERSHFAYIRAWSLGALPVRESNGSLAFPIGTRDFYACIHEIRAGLATSTLKIHKVYHSIYFDGETNFANFIDTYYAMRLDASAKGDDIRKLFYKLVMNSSYGKFAQDPRKYENWLFDPDEIPSPGYCIECHSRISKGQPKEECESCDCGGTSPYGWYLHTQREGRNIYASPQRVRAGSFYNVATAASITSAARASLLYGLQSARRPLYCDTDSIICEGFEGRENWGVSIDDKRLGAWKSEARGDRVAIAGKKLYAVYSDSECIKKASKGVKLTADEIMRVCAGEVIEYAHPVPKFKMDGSAQFTVRNIRRTG